MKTIRLIHFIRSLDIGNQGGGAEKFAITLSRELQNCGMEITLGVMLRFHSDVENEWAARLVKEGFQVEFLNDGPSPALFKSWKIFQNRFDNQPMDMGHGHYQVGNLLACMLKINKSLPVVVRTVHTPLEWGSGIQAWLARQTLTRFFFPLIMDEQICVNRSGVEQIRKYPGAIIGRKPITIIPNALPEEMIQYARTVAKNPRLINKGPKYLIVSIGRVTRLKGYEYLLRAIPGISKTFPSVEFWIVGDGPDLPRLEQMARDLGVSNQVVFTGQRNDIPSILEKADLFVLPSLVEALPTVILESMAYGVPVIATDLPGVREILEHDQTGWLVPPRDPARLGEQVCQALSSPPARQNIMSFAAKTVENYSIKKIAAEYLMIYQQLLSQK